MQHGDKRTERRQRDGNLLVAVIERQVLARLPCGTTVKMNRSGDKRITLPHIRAEPMASDHILNLT